MTDIASRLYEKIKNDDTIAKNTLDFYRALAENGDSETQFDYACMLYTDRRFYNKDEAMRWLHIAAENGHQQAANLIQNIKDAENLPPRVRPEIAPPVSYTIDPGFDQKFEDDFRELFTARLKEDEDFGSELWSAMANVSWIHKDDPDKTECGRSFRSAGSMIASMLGIGDYIDWYCSGPYETVSEYIAQAMASKGWRYELAGDGPGDIPPRKKKETKPQTLDDLENLVKPLIKNATKIIPHRKKPMPEGTNLKSHFNGQPYFEKGEQWPKTKDGEQMYFIFQVFNTGEINLPENIKLVQFYYDLDGNIPHSIETEDGYYCEEGSWLVKIYETIDTANSVIIENPETDRSGLYCEIEFVPIKSLPEDLQSYNESAYSLSCKIDEAHLQSNNRRFNSYWHIIDKLKVEMVNDGSQIGGYCWPTQGDPTPDDRDFVLLFQIDSEDEAGLHWVDMGRVYAFYNPKTKKVLFEIQFH